MIMMKKEEEFNYMHAKGCTSSNTYIHEWSCHVVTQRKFSVHLRRSSINTNMLCVIFTLH
jgi:hypothetical protein